MTTVQQISFAVPDKVYASIARRAAPMNIRVAEYARRLFEAAWLARVSAERAEPSGDAALDRQVRDVFLLADAEPEFIAETLGLSQETVERILAVWRGRDWERREPAAPSAASPAAENGYPVETIRQMWATGASAAEIATAIGKTSGALQQWANKHRDICPRRRNA